MTTEQLTLDTDDDIFARPPRALARQQATAQQQITCRVCDQLAKVPLDHDALICAGCRADVAASRSLVNAWLAAVDAQEQAAYDAWSRIASQHADFWAKIVSAGHTPATDARARAAHPTYALLLDAEAQYQQACVPLQAERARLERALDELNRVS